jgi:voltage-gated potassium channel
MARAHSAHREPAVIESRPLHRQGPAFAALLLSSVIVCGTIAYVVVEGWGWWDAFYMTVITVTTVGYKEVHDLTYAGQVVTVLLLFGGVGAALYTFTLATSAIIDGGLPKHLERRRQRRMLDTIKDHFIICGYGRIGGTVAAQFSRQHIPFVVIDRDPERVKQAIGDRVTAIEADASNDQVLKRAHIDRARGLIAALGTDADNVYTVLTARVLAPRLFIIGRAESEDGTRKLQQAGANRVVSPYQIGALQMAQTAVRPAVVDFVELATSTDNLELTMEQIPISDDSPLAQRSILEAGLRQKFGIIVVAIQRPEGHMEFNPEPDTPIRPGDTLVVLGRPQSLKRLESEAGS